MINKTRTLKWLAQLFNAKKVKKGNIVRRSIKSVDKMVGKEELIVEVKRRGFHLLTVGDQYVLVCNPGNVKIVC